MRGNNLFSHIALNPAPHDRLSLLSLNRKKPAAIQRVDPVKTPVTIRDAATQPAFPSIPYFSGNAG